MAWLVDAEPIPATTLASRDARFFAFLIDQVLSIVASWISRILALSPLGVLSFGCLMVFSIVQIVLVGTRGQTIGKLILRVAIVDHIDGTPPGFVRAALIRQLPLMIVVLFTPALALVYLFLDGSLIFASARRCVHDYVAGTIVINVLPDGSVAPGSSKVAILPSSVREVMCWSCKSPLAVTSETRGTKVECPACGTSQWLPI